MSKHHRLGDANTNSGCYNYWKRLIIVTERHNIASRLIIKTLNKGNLGVNIIFFIDIESETRMAQQSLVLLAHVANRTPMASIEPFSRRTSILLMTRCCLHTAS